MIFLPQQDLQSILVQWSHFALLDIIQWETHIIIIIIIMYFIQLLHIILIYFKESLQFSKTCLFIILPVSLIFFSVTARNKNSRLNATKYFTSDLDLSEWSKWKLSVLSSLNNSPLSNNWTQSSTSPSPILCYHPGFPFFWIKYS